MTRKHLSSTRITNIKLNACSRLRPVSRICFLSRLIRSSPVSEEKNSTFTENKALDSKIPQKENYDTVVRKTVAFYLHSIIRIKATDKEGNSIEVTY